MSEYKLTEEILSRSVSKSWDDAKREWKLARLRRSSVPETCLCGHFPILKICTIANVHNAIETNVGNCCVKKFLGLPSDQIFDAIERIHSGHSRALNMETLDFAFERGWITAKDHKFYVDTMRKRNLTERQESYRQGLNAKILRHLKIE
jgi:hypothetical protein